MKLNQGKLEPLGFKGSHPMATKKSVGVCYRKFGNNVIYVIPMDDTIGVFRLSPKQMKQFKKGDISLVPPGHCSVSGRETIEHSSVMWVGEVKSTAHLKKIMECIEFLLTDSQRCTTLTKPV